MLMITVVNVLKECNKKYFRPSEVESLIGDYSKAKKILNWKPSRDINALIKDMIS